MEILTIDLFVMPSKNPVFKTKQEEERFLNGEPCIDVHAEAKVLFSKNGIKQTIRSIGSYSVMMFDKNTERVFQCELYSLRSELLSIQKKKYDAEKFEKTARAILKEYNFIY